MDQVYHFVRHIVTADKPTGNIRIAMLIHDVDTAAIIRRN